MKGTFKVIPNGVLNRFFELTSRTEENSNMSIKEHYPDDTYVLARAGLGIKTFQL